MGKWLPILLAIKFLIEIGRKLLPQVTSLMKDKKVLSLIFLLLIVYAIMLLSTGCSLVEQKLDPNIVYRRDIKLNINGQDFDGIAVPKKSDSYKIKLKAYGKIDVLTIRSCHREEVFNKPSGGFFSSSKKFEYKYIPVNGIEDKGGCKLDIGAFEEKKGRHGFATIDFETGVENLPAIVKCDGKNYNTDPGSVSICQAREGSLQKIEFDHIVKSSPDPGCDILETQDFMNFSYIVPKDQECTIYFGDKYGNFHRHTVLGYSGILIRGD